MSNQQIGPNLSFELQSMFCKGLLSQKDVMWPHLLEEAEGARDTLQSLVQSCSCGNESHEMSNPSRGDCRHHLQPRGSMLVAASERLRNEKNIGGTQNFYYSVPQLDKQFSPSDAHAASEKDTMKHKTRIRWTEDLHKRFIECVDHLGGAKKATPKGILKLMKCDGLTIFHVKSHLQKYRAAELMPETKEGNAEQLSSTMGLQIEEALRFQLHVQRSLYKQLESQQRLQMRIEEQAKQLQIMFECQLKQNNSDS